jgi:hypothetical protein
MGDFMSRIWSGTILAATLLAVVASSPKPALAKKAVTSFTVDCLANDAALMASEGVSTAPVAVTITPATLKPPNHKFKNETITMSLTNNSTTPVDLAIAITDITDDQLVEDDTKGEGCGPPSTKQGPDWQPIDFTALTASGTLQNTTDTPLAISGVKLRAERCTKVGTRTYSLAVTCTDTTNSVTDATPVLLVTVPKGK